MINMPPSPENNPIRFAGRDAIFARIQQQVLDPSHRHALVFLGHDGIGKTALLQQCLVVFDDPILPIYISLSETQFTDDADFVQVLANGINQHLNERNFSQSRIPEFEGDDNLDFLDWFRDAYLPEVFHVIRAHRRIVCLLDDAEQLSTFSDDFLAYLQTLLREHLQLSLVLSVHTEHEAQLEDLSPLVNAVLAERIHRLSEDDSGDLIRQYAPGAEDSITESIFEATGGHPRLLTRFGQILHGYWQAYSNSEAFERAKPDVYQGSVEDFRQLWRRLSRHERLVLTAIASLIYDDPTQIISGNVIEAWLVETDYALDIVTINAALRGLDYQDIVSSQQNEGIKLTTGLMQQWLLEEARLDDTDEEKRGQLPFRLIVIVAVIIIVIIVVLMLIPPQYLDGASAIPTATLAN